ncbi:hypothetical protein FF47_10 [Mycobacterium phage FF47]|uniref:Uncharacterized protein n=1 Tax=Mycobacterium phage FF47 TaxID=1305710 RepID=M4W8E4_9CAUD|nr:hypothetical protein FF47_10 [Mycobacterium phage FF47]AGI12278.1 hypothetical protein FF47_10 [Mycobacterium phage FF47]
MKDLRKKSAKTVVFVGEDGTELNVVTSISKESLAILKRKGYKRKRDETPAPKKAPAKATPSTQPENEDETPPEDDAPTPTRPPAPRKRPAK